MSRAEVYEGFIRNDSIVFGARAVPTMAPPVNEAGLKGLVPNPVTRLSKSTKALPGLISRRLKFDEWYQSCKRNGKSSKSSPICYILMGTSYITISRCHHPCVDIQIGPCLRVEYLGHMV